MHWKKLRKRGYNQSDVFAEGLSESMAIPWVVDGLRRNENSESQTKKSKMSRLENVMAVFEVKNRKKLEGKHILLVDDVLTSGATLDEDFGDSRDKSELSYDCGGGKLMIRYWVLGAGSKYPAPNTQYLLSFH
jgi:hypothetical protein